MLQTFEYANSCLHLMEVLNGQLQTFEQTDYVIQGSSIPVIWRVEFMNSMQITLTANILIWLIQFEVTLVTPQLTKNPLHRSAYTLAIPVCTSGWQWFSRNTLCWLGSRHGRNTWRYATLNVCTCCISGIKTSGARFGKSLYRGSISSIRYIHWVYIGHVQTHPQGSRETGLNW